MDAWTEQLNDAKGLADECFLALQQRPQAATAADLARLTAHSRRKLNALSSAVEALEEGLAGAGVSDNEAARRSDVVRRLGAHAATLADMLKTQRRGARPRGRAAPRGL